MAAKSCCTDSASAELLQALDEFNREQWFECHETLEDLWAGSEWEMRDFYQGLLHVAVALHHWRNGNFGGSVSLLKSGSGYLRRVRAACQGVDVEAMVAAADRFRDNWPSSARSGWTGSIVPLSPVS